MSRPYKIRVSKCYLVQIVDENEDEIGSEYVFTNTKTDAIQHGKMPCVI